MRSLAIHEVIWEFRETSRRTRGYLLRNVEPMCDFCDGPMVRLGWTYESKK